MKNIKIFVSNRIDMDCKQIKNPLLIPVRCGAVYDKRPFQRMKGDNTGDNISEQRIELGELTVQYWAWKNVKADYYGLFHYRRFLSFADEKFDVNADGFIVETEDVRASATKYGLCDSKLMADEIEKYDAIVSYKNDIINIVRILPAPKNVNELWLGHIPTFIKPEIIEECKNVIKDLFPEYTDSMEMYFEQNMHLGYNLFVMKRDMFFEMCEFEFGVLFELQKRVKEYILGKYSERAYGYVMEMLYSIFIFKMQSEGKRKIKEVQPIIYSVSGLTKKKKEKKKAFRENLKSMAKSLFPAYRTALRIEQNQVKIMNELSFLHRSVGTLNLIKNRQEMQIWLSKLQYPENADGIVENKISFWKNYPKATGTLKLVQNGNFSMLKRMKQICDTIGVNFWLHGGSLVGGLRHNGCVPWDDDIDVAMMRSDFIKLKEYLDSDDNLPYEIKEYYYQCFGCRSYRFHRKDIEANCFVDIFLYDYINFNGLTYKELWDRVVLLKKTLIREYQIAANENSIKGNNLTLEENLDFKDKIDYIVDSFIVKYDQDYNSDGNYDAICWGMDNTFGVHPSFAWKNGRIFYKNDIFPLKICVYDGEEFYIPNDYEKYVYAEYGINYLEMPGNMGVSGHFNEYFGLEEQIEKVKQLLELECFDKES